MEKESFIIDYFTERKKYGIKPGLERMHMLLTRLDHPEEKIKIVHIAGTNGKGSTANFIKDVLIASSYRVGFFTSPSFTGIEGHFMINHQQISVDELFILFNRVRPIVEELDAKGHHPTEFEILTAMAFIYFVGKTDIVLIEAGMGGREDTTNVVRPLVSVITSISFDHMQFLGTSLAEIASHKAGIIKENRPVVTGNLGAEALGVIQKEAQQKKATHYQYGIDYHVKEINHTTYFVQGEKKIALRLAFGGIYQEENIALGLAVLYLLASYGYVMRQERIEKVMYHFTLPGRFERVSDHPSLILDSAHNLAGIDALKQSLQAHYPDREISCLFAVFVDKDIDAMMNALETDQIDVFLTTFHHDRAAKIEDLRSVARKGTIIENWQGFIQTCLEQKQKEEITVITGSMHFIMQVRAYIMEIKNRK